MRQEWLRPDSRGRVSLGRLGLEGDVLIADELPDQTGWVIRPGRVMTAAEQDVLGRPENVEALVGGLADIEAGRTRPRRRDAAR